MEFTRSDECGKIFAEKKIIVTERMEQLAAIMTGGYYK